MTEEEKDILILKILERPQSLTEEEVTLILSDQELLDIYNTSLKVKDAVRPPLKVDPNKEWELIKARIKVSEKEDRESTIPTPTPVLQTEEVRMSFISSFLHNITKRPVAAAVGTFILAGAFAIGLLWNPEPIKQEGNSGYGSEGLAQNIPNNNNSNLVTVINNGTVEVNDKESANPQEHNAENKDALINNETPKTPQNQSIPSKKESQNQNETPLIETSEGNVTNTPLNQNEGNLTVINDPNAQQLAYVEEDINGLGLDQLSGQFPEDWDIDECLKLQQARIDNELALRMAESRKKEYEMLRENILWEYEISNPDADEATLKELKAYLDEVYGNLYSAIP